MSGMLQPLKQTGLRQAARPIGLRAPARAPTGPRLYSRAPERRGIGPGIPPDGFVGGTTSRSEWFIYWALAKVFNDPVNPRQPPFFGGRDWGFQIGVLGSFTRQLGSAVVDFVVYTPRDQIFIRIQTQRFHEGFGPAQQGYDVIQRSLLQSQGTVVDIFEGDYIHDETGQAAIVVTKQALSLIERLSPIVGGTSQSRS